MNDFFPDFERLFLEDRVKFIKVGDRFLVYNVRDSQLVEVDSPGRFEKEFVTTPLPPPKTLILHTTYECNLACNHCYINAGKKREGEMESFELARIVDQFGGMGGLGVDLSGGEALLKKGIESVIKVARKNRLRTVVLSNAVNLDRKQLERIAGDIDGIAVGIDGLYDANDRIRGAGSFQRILGGLDIIADLGIDLSVTTLITPESLPELVRFPEFVSKYGGKSWSLVMPRPSGRFASEREEIDRAYALWEEAKADGLLQRLQKESQEHHVSVVLDHILVPGAKRKVEESSGDFVYMMYNKGRACWDNTLTVMPNGDVKCCLFFDGQVYDNVRDKSLREVYTSLKRERALNEFRKYPVDKCPFVESGVLRKFDAGLK